MKFGIFGWGKEQVMDFTKLPEEIFIQILTYLDIKDLLLCSLVCKYWRQVVNVNSIWRQACHKNADTLDSIPCLDSKEEGIFYEITNKEQIYRDGEPLQPLCKWRINYMKYCALVYNIHHGNYNLYKIKKPSACSNIKFCDAFIAFANNFENCIEVWNIRSKPFRQDCIKFSLRNVDINIYEISPDYLVIVQCNLLEIYKYNGANFILMYRRLCNLPQISSNQVPALDDISEWYHKNSKLSPNVCCIRHIFNGEFFVGILSGYDFKSPLIHIWDIKTGKKVKETVIPGLQKDILDITFYSVNCCIFIKVVFQTVETRILGYSLKTQEFTHFDIQMPYVLRAVIFKNTVAVVLQASFLSVWDIETGIQLDQINTTSRTQISLKTFDVFNRYFAFAFLEEDVIYIMKLSEPKMEAIGYFSTSYGNITHLSFLHNNLLMASMLHSSYFIVYDVKNLRALYKLQNIHFTVDVARSRYNTKAFFFFRDRIKILNFW